MIATTYNKKQLKEILISIGVRIASETGTDYLCMCPFHDNHHTPSFAVSYEKGLYVCYNPSCGSKGKIIELIQSVGDLNYFQALRLVESTKKQSENTFDDDLAELLSEKPVFEPFSQELLDSLYSNLVGSKRAQDYFEGRNITQDSMAYFQLGYSDNQDMVIVPIHSPTGIPVGVVGRSVEGKKFKNSTNLPKSQTMFNLHRAKKESSTIIVCESSFDAIRIHQAGYPNVVATLGGTLSKENVQNLNKYSSSIIIATDADEAGRKLGKELSAKLKNKNIMWASYSNGIIYPNGAKDVGDLTDEEIKQCIKNAVTNFEYFNW